MKQCEKDRMERAAEAQKENLVHIDQIGTQVSQYGQAVATRQPFNNSKNCSVIKALKIVENPSLSRIISEGNSAAATRQHQIENSKAVVMNLMAFMQNQKFNDFQTHLGLYLYHKGNSKGTLTLFHSLGLSVCYKTLRKQSKSAVRSYKRQYPPQFENIVVLYSDDYTRINKFKQIRSDGQEYRTCMMIVNGMSCLKNTEPCRAPLTNDDICDFPTKGKGFIDAEAMKLIFRQYPPSLNMMGKFEITAFYEYNPDRREHSEYLKDVRFNFLIESKLHSPKDVLFYLRHLIKNVIGFKEYATVNYILHPGDFWANFHFKTLRYSVLIDPVNCFDLVEEVPTDEEKLIIRNIIPSNGLFHIALTLTEAVITNFHFIVNELWVNLFPNKRQLSASKINPQLMFRLTELCTHAWNNIKDDVMKLKSNSMELKMIKLFFDEYLPLCASFYYKIREGVTIDDLKKMMVHATQVFISLDRSNYRGSALEWLTMVGSVEKKCPALYEAIAQDTRRAFDEWAIEYLNSVTTQYTDINNDSKTLIKRSFRCHALRDHLESFVELGPKTIRCD